MKRICASAEPYEAACRTRWVEVWGLPNTGVPDADVIGACVDDDCRFIALDLRPLSDVLAQVARCSITGPFVEHCARHAFQRWVGGRPSADEVQQMLLGPAPFPAIAATYAGQAMGCARLGVCSGEWVGKCAEGMTLALSDPTACSAAGTSGPAPSQALR